MPSPSGGAASATTRGRSPSRWGCRTRAWVWCWRARTSRAPSSRSRRRSRAWCTRCSGASSPGYGVDGPRPAFPAPRRRRTPATTEGRTPPCARTARPQCARPRVHATIWVVPQAPHVDASAEGRSKACRERARLEAGRYGPDPWIFVRELLQNSRDAGARTVSLLVRDDLGIERVLCRDDGEGMSFEHARRYLFSLYASSKEDAKNQAGKFGVGFWSILRFEPRSIAIRSRPRVGPGWGLRLDGSLEHATHVEPPETIGTEILLERPGGDGRLDHRVYDAVWQSARYLYTRDDPDRALIVTVNDRPANAEFTLPAPSAAFRRGAVRGVVGLGPAPRVELFSRGLRVRSAASLEDLLAPTGRHTARMRVRFPELPGGLAPQALLESDKLELMLSRSDARDTRALAKLVRLGQQELERLIERQLSHTRPLPWYHRWWVAGKARLRDSVLVRAGVGTMTGLVLALAIGWGLWGRPHTATPRPSTPAPSAAIDDSGAPPPRAYRDLGARYRGPKVDVLSPGSAEPIPLTYTPGHDRLYF